MCCQLFSNILQLFQVLESNMVNQVNSLWSWVWINWLFVLKKS